MAELTAKQKLFADFYVGEGNLNATRSARLAGYRGDDNALAAAGSRLLRNVKIREYVDTQLEKLTLSQNEVLTILTRQAKGSLADVLDDEGKFDLKDAKRRGVDSLLKKLKITETFLKSGDVERRYEYEIHDPKDAAVHIGKYHKLFTDKHEHAGPNGGPMEVKQTQIVVQGVKGGDGPK